MIITFEGVDGSGKTTAIYRLSQWIQDTFNRKVTVLNPMLDTHVGRNIQALIDTKQHINNDALIHLYMACHYQLSTHVQLLDEPDTVYLCDRGVASTYAYQGHLKSGDFEISRTIYLDINYDTHVKRITDRGQDRPLLREKFIDIKIGYDRFFKLYYVRQDVVKFDANGAQEEIDRQIRGIFKRWHTQTS